MKKVWMVLSIMIVAAGLLGITGCKQETKPTPAPAVAPAAAPAAEKAPAPAEVPADQKPKDHPAH